MRKSLVLVLLLLSAAQYSQAQVDNYALRFSGKGSVTCGELVDMEQQKSYTLQFWMNPDVWTDGATVFSSGDSFSASLGAEGSIIFKVGDTNLSATATQQFSAGKWTQVTLVCNDGTAQVCQRRQVWRRQPAGYPIYELSSYHRREIQRPSRRDAFLENGTHRRV